MFQGWGRRSRGGLGLALVLGLIGQAAAGGEPLRDRIDRAIEAGSGGVFAPAATDGEFLRRVHLDLVGVIPTADEARAFLDDPSPYKRAKLIDRLLETPEYARRMATAFDVMLMERRPDQHVPSVQWLEFLRDAFEQNLPFDQLARRILEADGDDPDRRAPAKFYLDRGADPYTLTRDVGRLFLGRDMQCAQCHDHVLIDAYKQAHYYGLYAFFSRSYAVQDARGVTVLGEKADGDVSFTSVFEKKVTHKTGPRILEAAEVADAAVAPGDEYAVYPLDKLKAIPRNSRRARLAPLLTSGQVKSFNRNIVNRLWALMMGRGLVHPLDFDHDDNPPSHPELLDELEREFVSGGFDVKAFIRELALSRTYARSSEPPPGISASDDRPERFLVGAIRPLSPEQLGWSVMQGTGVLANYRSAAEHTILGVDPRMRAIVETDPARRALGRRMVEQRVFEQLSPSLAAFIQRYGRPPGQSQDGGDASVHQALFLSNGQPVQSWLAANPGHLIGRLAAISDPSMLADELYLALLTRRPADDERREVAAYLKDREKDRTQAIQELAWSLLNSTEFRYNH